MGAARAGVDRPAMDQPLAGTKISKDKKSPRTRNLRGAWGISASQGIGVGSSNEASSNKPATAPAAPHHGQHAGTSMPHRFGKCAETWAVGASTLVDCHVGSRCPSPFWVLAGPATAPFLGWPAAERLQNGLGEYHLSFQGEPERASMLSVIPHGLPRPLPRPLPLTGASAS